MDSLTQITLGAAVSEAIVGKKIGRKATLWGALLGTFPDLDVFIPLGDPVADFIYHRSFSHSLFVLGILTPLFAWIISKIHKLDKSYFRHINIAVISILYTHIFLDCLTVYGTQIFWPLTNYPVSIGSIFIIDPMYTVPLLIGVILCLIMRRNDRGHKINNIGLILSSMYLIWTLTAQYAVGRLAKKSLDGFDIRNPRILVIPTPFNSFLWRIAAISDKGYYVGYYSIFDKSDNISFQFIPSRYDVADNLLKIERVKDLKRFTHGLWSIDQIDGNWAISDIRMGLEDAYAFRFVVSDENFNPITIYRHESLRDLSKVNLLFDRIFDSSVKF